MLFIGFSSDPQLQSNYRMSSYHLACEILPPIHFVSVFAIHLIRPRVMPPSENLLNPSHPWRVGHLMKERI